MHFYFLKKTTFIWFINLFNYGDTKNVLINHLLLVTPMSYLCHFTNLCPHKPHKHAPPPTHTRAYIYIYIYIYTYKTVCVIFEQNVLISFFWFRGKILPGGFVRFAHLFVCYRQQHQPPHDQFLKQLNATNFGSWFEVRLLPGSMLNISDYLCSPLCCGRGCTLR